MFPNSKDQKELVQEIIPINKIEKEADYQLNTTPFSETLPNYLYMKNDLRHVNCIYFNRLTLFRLIGFFHY
jgi:hypothetical protein